MINKYEAQKLRSAPKPLCQPTIGFARRWVAAWMIVDNDDRVSSVENRGTENFARMCETFIEAAEGNLFCPDQAQLGIEQDNAQRLAKQHCHLGAQKVPDIKRMLYAMTIWLLAGGPDAELKSSGQLNGLRAPYTLNLGKLRNRSP